MDDYRIWLALASAGSGIALLLTAGYVIHRDGWSPGRSRRLSALLAYGCMFLVVGAVVWMRDYGRHRPSANPPVAESPIESHGSVQPDTSNLAPKPPIQVDTRVGEVLTSKSIDVEPPARPLESNAVPERPVPIRRNRKVHLQSSKTSPKARGDLSESVFQSACRAFTAIELWFDKWGSPTPDNSVRQSELAADGENEQIAFPDVGFRAETAELDSASQVKLKSLAVRIRGMKQGQLLEIEARVRDGHSGPFDYILTQARAQVVRDFLVAEGVDTRMIVARAMGSDSVDSGKAGSQIRFSARP